LKLSDITSKYRFNKTPTTIVADSTRIVADSTTLQPQLLPIQQAFNRHSTGIQQAFNRHSTGIQQAFNRHCCGRAGHSALIFRRNYQVKRGMGRIKASKLHRDY